MNGRNVANEAGWGDTTPTDVAADLHPGRNVLAIRAENMKAPVVKNPAGLIASLVIEPESGPAISIGSDATWKSSRDESPGWQAVGFAAEGWSKARDLGPLGIPPWGAFASREEFPPLCIGGTDGARVCYLLDARAVVIRGLVPGRTYKTLTSSTPSSGTTREAGPLKGDASGSAERAAPAHGHDWVLAILPE